MSLWKRLFSTSALLSAIRAFGAGIGFLTQLLLARLLDPDELGTFYFVTGVVAIASLVVATGYPNLMTRFVSRYRERGQSGRLAAFVREAQIETVKWGAIGAAALSAAALLWPDIAQDMRFALIFGALTIIPMGVQRVQGALGTAYRRFISAYLATLVVRPALFAAVLGGLLIASAPVSVALLTAITLGVTMFSMLVQHTAVRDVAYEAVKRKADARLLRRWRREAWPLVMVAIFTSLLSDLAVVLATPFMPMADVGAFGICLKIAFLIGFTVQVSHQVILPDMSDAIARREHSGLSAKIVGASLFPIVLTVGGVAFSMLFGGWFLSLFDEHFRSAQDTLTILMLAQFARAFAGPSSLLLTLKGAQVENAWICVASMAVLLVGNAVCGPIWGAEGAAVAVLVTTVFWLGATGFVLHRRDGARADILGVLSMTRTQAVTPAE